MSLKKLIDLPDLGDERGGLVSIEANQHIPFEIKRLYYIFNTTNQSRGFHAHIDLKQVAVCVKGSCRFILDNGHAREEVTLNSPTQGLYIEALTWREMHDFSEDCVLLVLASEHYDETDYIRSYDEFLSVVNRPFIHPLSDVHSTNIGQTITIGSSQDTNAVVATQAVVTGKLSQTLANARDSSQIINLGSVRGASGGRATTDTTVSGNITQSATGSGQRQKVIVGGVEGP